MVDLQELALAQAYEGLAASPAFQNLLTWLREDMEAAERAVSDATAEESNKTVRAKFIAWQQRKIVLSSIQGKIDAARDYARDAVEELDIERRIESDRSSRTEW